MHVTQKLLFFGKFLKGREREGGKTSFKKFFLPRKKHINTLRCLRFWGKAERL